MRRVLALGTLVVTVVVGSSLTVASSSAQARGPLDPIVEKAQQVVTAACQAAPEYCNLGQ